MEWEGFLADDAAVSPVIGVILMVAITVILAAAVGSFALGLPDQAEPETTVPEVGISFDYDSGPTTSPPDDLYDASDPTDAELTITHKSGEIIDADDIVIRDDDGNTVDGTALPMSEISAGSTVDIYIGSDDTVRVVYAPTDIDTSAVLGEYEAPNT